VGGMEEGVNDVECARVCRPMHTSKCTTVLILRILVTFFLSSSCLESPFAAVT